MTLISQFKQNYHFEFRKTALYNLQLSQRDNYFHKKNRNILKSNQNRIKILWIRNKVNQEISIITITIPNSGTIFSIKINQIIFNYGLMVMLLI